MEDKYKKKLQIMVDNFNVLIKHFRWQNQMVVHNTALTFSIKEKRVDVDLIKQVQEYIKSNTKTLSPFRHMVFALSGLLCATSDNPQKQFDNMLSNKDRLESVGFKNNRHLPTTLYTLSNVYDGDDVVGYSEKAMNIHRDMKKNHPFLTGGDDYAFAILLAGLEHNMDLLEEYYEALEYRGFSISNGLQMLSHIMSFSKDSVIDTVNRCECIYNYLKENKLNVYTEFYPVIGLVSLLDVDKDELLTNLVEITHYLNKQVRYKSLGKGMNLIMASGIIASECIKEMHDDTLLSATISVSIETLIATQNVTTILLNL